MRTREAEVAEAEAAGCPAETEAVPVLGGPEDAGRGAAQAAAPRTQVGRRPTQRQLLRDANLRVRRLEREVKRLAKLGASHAEMAHNMAQMAQEVATVRRDGDRLRKENEGLNREVAILRERKERRKGSARAYRYPPSVVNAALELWEGTGLPLNEIAFRVGMERGDGTVISTWARKEKRTPHPDRQRPAHDGVTTIFERGGRL